MNNHTIRKPDDLHIHLRQGEMLKEVIGFTAQQCRRALVMPNTIPPVLSDSDVRRYREEIEAAIPEDVQFTPLMTFKIVDSIAPEMVPALSESGAVGGKLYPEGVTTNSEDGVKDIESLFPLFESMSEHGLVLCIHGETPGTFSMDREETFLPTLEKIARRFPALKIVFEHASTARAIEVVESLHENVAATITAHHLKITLDDLLGGKLNPHNFCKPVVKRPEDRDALIKAATSGNPKFFLGSDSAPHSIEAKECCEGAAGVFTAPILLPLLADLFEEHGALEKLEFFTSEAGAKFYGLPLNEEKITLVKKPFVIPKETNGIVPFLAGETLTWSL